MQPKSQQNQVENAYVSYPRVNKNQIGSFTGKTVTLIGRLLQVG